MMVEREYLGRDADRGPIKMVAFLHRDGECVWRRDGARRWTGVFSARAA